jgi:hypothetical protein
MHVWGGLCQNSFLLFPIFIRLGFGRISLLGLWVCRGGLKAQTVLASLRNSLLSPLYKPTIQAKKSFRNPCRASLEECKELDLHDFYNLVPFSVFGICICTVISMAPASWMRTAGRAGARPLKLLNKCRYQTH